MSPGGSVQVIGITQRFGGLTAVDDVHVAIPAGAIHGIIGPNGAGKTTLLNIISGLQRPTSGTVQVGEHQITGWPGHRLVTKARMVRTFQTVRLFGSMTVQQNIEIAAGTVHRGRQQRDRRTAEVIAELGLESHAADPATSLSYGLQRQVELARVLVADPLVVLLDEPAAGLSPTERHDLAQTLRVMNGRGITVVLVEHHMDLVHAVCQTCTVLDFGAVISSGTPQEVTRDPAVLEAYLGGSHHAVADDLVIESADERVADERVADERVADEQVGEQ